MLRLRSKAVVNMDNKLGARSSARISEPSMVVTSVCQNLRESLPVGLQLIPTGPDTPGLFKEAPHAGSSAQPKFRQHMLEEKTLSLGGQKPSLAVSLLSQDRASRFCLVLGGNPGRTGSPSQNTYDLVSDSLP